jgi:tRNA-dihydrouridine synthase B
MRVDRLPLARAAWNGGAFVLFTRKRIRLDSRLPWLADLRLLLAPMSGISDRPFRDLCRAQGMQLGFCEFASAAGLLHGNAATWRLVDTEGEAGPVGVQIFGDDPVSMATAARLLAGRRCDVLDVNLGCPARKVVRRSGGSALLADLPRLASVVQAVVAASPVPVSAKIRSGWDGASVNYLEVGLLLQELGCAWVTLHARTRQQKYRGRADWDHIARLVARLEIPVVGNGDVRDGASYAELVRHTGCHAVMVGRGAVGRPWLFAELAGLESGRPWMEPSRAEICRIMLGHVLEVRRCGGEKAGWLATRKHLARGLRGWPGAALLRRRLFAAETSDEMVALLLAETVGEGGHEDWAAGRDTPAKQEAPTAWSLEEAG